jgi:transposase
MPHPPDSFVVEILIVTLKRYQQRNELRARMEGRAEQTFRGNASFEHMKIFPGVGSIIALTIMAEPGNAQCFTHHLQFLEYCKLNLAKQQSGN